jgi:hypothetical protein
MGKGKILNIIHVKYVVTKGEIRKICMLKIPPLLWQVNCNESNVNKVIGLLNKFMLILEL